MHFICAFIVLSLGSSHCFTFSQLRDLLELKIDGSSINSNAKVSEEWIEQPLDHFDTNKATWKMRYYKRLDFWKPGGPIYLFINGEAPADSSWISTDSLLICQLAKETNGALFISEHRYYGKSMPVQITDTSSMKYLSSKQALADVSELIKFIKSATEFKSSKVVVIGGSYAGNLAAWMKVLYTDLIDAVVSASAPVLAKKDFYEYLETVSDDYENYGSNDCLNKIKTAFNYYAGLLKTSSGIETLKNELNICNDSDMSSPENQALYFSSAILGYEGDAQYGDPAVIQADCESFNTNNWALSMQNGVKVALEQVASQRSGSKVKNVFQRNKRTRLVPSFRDNKCLEVNFTKAMENIKAEQLSWFYQTCTEFGYYQTTTSNEQAFNHTIPLDFYIKQCHLIFGDEFNEKRVDDGVAQTNAMYGGVTPKVSNVVFTHGDMDPWHTLGVLKDLSETVVVRITNGTSHCAVLRDPDPSDSNGLINDREFVKRQIKEWIK